MKLQFLKPYPNSSITEKFDDIEINDFTVITGKNGVGKTHLLEAIVHNDNYINIDDGINAIYFNYNDFVVENTANNQQKNKSQLKKKNGNSHNINQDIQNLKREISKYIQAPLVNAFRQNDQLINQVYSYIINRVDFLNIPFFDDFQNNLVKFTGDKELLNSIYNLLKQSIDNFKKLKNEKFDFYYNKANSLNISISQINNNYLEYKETWLGQLLENEFKNYIRAYDKVYRQIIRESSNAITKVEIEKKTIEKVGIAPWIMLNEILEKYSCNGYIIDKDLAYGIETYQNIDQQPLNIVLKNYETNRVINLDRLSSGEKTLFALAVALYRQVKDQNLPTVLLLDEIDSSLHPSMCRQLLDVLENVFVKEHNLKIIMVTHSPSTVALAPDNSVYVLENINGKISLENKIKEKAISYLSDGFLTFEEGIGLLQKPKTQVYLEGTTDIDYWLKTFEFFKDEFEMLNENIEIIDGNGGESKRTHKNLSNIPQHYILSKHIFVFDCDEQKQENIDEKLCFIKNDFNKNSLVEDGIENLFSKDILEKAYILKADFFKKTIVEDRGKTITSYKVHPDEKRNLCNWICENGTQEDFIVFKPIIEKVKSILNL